jgi:hypothetical protein
VKALNINDQEQKRVDAAAAAFHNWKIDEPVPLEIAGRAWARAVTPTRGIKTLDRSVADFGAGDFADWVERMTRKAKPTQLIGKPNPVMVLSAWHRTMFGAPGHFVRETLHRSLRYSGIFYAVTYGKKHDDLYNGDRLPFCQRGDGIFLRWPKLGAVVWLLFDGSAHVDFNSRLLGVDARSVLASAFI